MHKYDFIDALVVALAPALRPTDESSPSAANTSIVDEALRLREYLKNVIPDPPRGTAQTLKEGMRY